MDGGHGTRCGGPGARKSTDVTTSQIAATLAMLVGEKFEGVTRPAAPPLQLR